MKNANDPLISRRNIKWLILAGGLAISAAIYSAKLYLDRRFQAEVSRLTEILQLRPGIAVGEIGAGDGAMTIAIATRAGPNGHVFPTEIDPKLIEKIHRAVEEHKLNTVTALPATASDTGLPENCCDAVFMRGVYHHLTDPADIDRNLQKALRPGGQLAVIDFPPKLWLWPWKPSGVPANRGGHGIPQAIMIDEVTSADFQVMKIFNDWPGGSYCVLFRKPTQILITMQRGPANPLPFYQL